jgi:hypothetical protein
MTAGMHATHHSPFIVDYCCTNIIGILMGVDDFGVAMLRDMDVEIGMEIGVEMWVEIDRDGEDQVNPSSGPHKSSIHWAAEWLHI